MHLIHPAFVHLSVAFLAFGGVTEIVGLLARYETARRFGEVLVLLGTASLLPTLASGYVAANTVSLDEASRGLLELHERNGWIVLGLWVAALFWKGWNRGVIPSGQRFLFVALLVVAVVITGYSALLGGELVYGHGVGTSLFPEP